MTRVAVTGGRRYTDVDHVYAVLDDVTRYFAQVVVVQGAAHGADAVARSWALERGHGVEDWPADWAGLGRRAGPVRNKRMLASRPDVLVAFPGGRGTAHAVNEAHRLGIPVHDTTEEP